MARSILKTSNRILRTNGKIFQVGEYRPPVSMWNNTTSMAGLTDGQAASTWLDVSGSMNHFTQATNTKWPIYRANDGGLACLEFDGVDDYLGNAMSLPIGTVFMVARQRTIAQEKNFLQHTTNSNYWATSTNYWFRPPADVPGTFGHQSVAGYGYNKLYKNGSPALDALGATKSTYWTLLCLDVTNANIYINGVGGCPNGYLAPHSPINFAHLEIYNYRMTTTDRKIREAQLLTQYNIV